MKLKYENIFSILWPGSSRKAEALKINMYEPFDFAMQALTEFPFGKASSDKLPLKLNAVNFLYEFIKYDEVKLFLEK